MLLDSLKIRKDPEPLSDLPSLEIWNYKKYHRNTHKKIRKKIHNITRTLQFLKNKANSLFPPYLFVKEFDPIQFMKWKK